MKMYPPQSKSQWDGWIIGKTTHHQFPQSWEWGEILRAEGQKVDRYVFEQDNQVMVQIQLSHHHLPGGWLYSFAPKGPVLAQNYTGGILVNFKDFLVKNKVVFVRVEPAYDLIRMSFPILPTRDINPRATVILDLAKTEEKLLGEMHHKTRYNIHLAQKKGVKIEKLKDFKILMDLMKQTAKRDGFHLHPDKHYQKILESPMSRQLIAYFQGRVIATAVFVEYGDTFTYLYGASDYDQRPLMAPYLIQWEAIKLAKQAGYKYYDLFGIAPGARNQGGDYIYDPRHKYAGITRFKMGFGGDISVSPGTLDLVIDQNKYRLYRLARWLRRLV